MPINKGKVKIFSGKYCEYIQYAKVLLPDNQMLEAIGVKVKAK
jgi:hypothetical protein